MPQDIPKLEVNIGSCTGLVLSGNKPLPKPMLTQIYDAILWSTLYQHFYRYTIMMSVRGGWGLGAFLRWWPLSTMWAGPLIYFRGCLNNRIFGLCTACWARFMCHHELWPTSVTHPCSVNSSWEFAGGKYCQKNTIPIFRRVLQNSSSLF